MLIRRWRYRGAAPAPERAAVELEAAVDLRDALLEAKAARIAELEGELAKTKALLATALTLDYMARGLRTPARLVDRDFNGPTVVLPRTLLRRFRR